MKKIALFVEGLTEMIFARELLVAIAGARHIAFHEERYHAKSFLPLRSDAINGQTYFAMIVDCGSDSSVVTAMLDSHPRLTSAGYDCIIGLRDLYPKSAAELPALQAGLDGLMPQAGSRSIVIVATHEVEAWFIQEEWHYPKIDPALSKAVVKTQMGFDIDSDCAEHIPHPASWLNTTYRIAGKSYRKKKKSLQRTVNSLDMQNLYFNLPAKLPSLKLLTDELADFLS